MKEHERIHQGSYLTVWNKDFVKVSNLALAIRLLAFSLISDLEKGDESNGQRFWSVPSWPRNRRDSYTRKKINVEWNIPRTEHFSIPWKLTWIVCRLLNLVIIFFFFLNFIDVNKTSINNHYPNEKSSSFKFRLVIPFIAAKRKVFWKY